MTDIKLNYSKLYSMVYSKKIGLDVKAYKIICNCRCKNIVIEFSNGYRVLVNKDSDLETKINADIKIIDSSLKQVDVVY